MYNYTERVIIFPQHLGDTASPMTKQLFNSLDGLSGSLLVELPMKSNIVVFNPKICNEYFFRATERLDRTWSAIHIASNYIHNKYNMTCIVRHLIRRQHNALPCVLYITTYIIFTLERPIVKESFQFSRDWPSQPSISVCWMMSTVERRRKTDNTGWTSQIKLINHEVYEFIPNKSFGNSHCPNQKASIEINERIAYVAENIIRYD